jgi:hypothetical protein
MSDESEEAPPNHLESSKSDYTTLIIAAVPLAPFISLLLVPERFDSDPLSAAICAIPMLTLNAAYLVAWVLSRLLRERRFVFRADGVWLPANTFWLRGRFVPYPELKSVEVYSSGRRVRVSYRGGLRDFNRQFVDPRELERVLKVHWDRYRPPQPDQVYR